MDPKIGEDGFWDSLGMGDGKKNSIFFFFFEKLRRKVWGSLERFIAIND